MIIFVSSDFIGRRLCLTRESNRPGALRQPIAKKVGDEKTLGIQADFCASPHALPGARLASTPGAAELRLHLQKAAEEEPGATGRSATGSQVTEAGAGSVLGRKVNRLSPQGAAPYPSKRTQGPNQRARRWCMATAPQRSGVAEISSSRRVLGSPLSYRVGPWPAILG